MRLRWLPVLALALAACGSRADDAEIVAEDTTSSTTMPTTTSDSVPTTSTTEPGSPASATATAAGIELTLTVERGAVEAGTRLWADLVITNVGTETVYWQAGGCGDPGVVSLEPTGSDDDARWDGDPATFATLVRAHDALGAVGFADEPGWRSKACTADSIMKAFAPGERLQRRAAADVRLAPGAGGAFVARAAFTTYADPDDYGYQETDHPRPAATVSVPIEVHASPSNAEEAIDAFAASDALRTFVDRSRTTDVENTWSIELCWWRGAWEVWVDPYFSEGDVGALRMRFDPGAGEIVDARIVYSDVPPEDDPDATRPAGVRSDEVLS